MGTSENLRREAEDLFGQETARRLEQAIEQRVDRSTEKLRQKMAAEREEIVRSLMADFGRVEESAAPPMRSAPPEEAVPVPPPRRRTFAGGLGALLSGAVGALGGLFRRKRT